MTSSSPTSLLDVELRPGSPAVLRAGAPVDPAHIEDIVAAFQVRTEHLLVVA